MGRLPLIESELASNRLVPVVEPSVRILAGQCAGTGAANRRHDVPELAHGGDGKSPQTERIGDSQLARR